MCLAISGLEYRRFDFRVDADHKIQEIERMQVGHAVFADKAVLGQEMASDHVAGRRHYKSMAMYEIAALLVGSDSSP